MDRMLRSWNGSWTRFRRREQTLFYRLDVKIRRSLAGKGGRQGVEEGGKKNKL